MTVTTVVLPQPRKVAYPDQQQAQVQAPAPAAGPLGSRAPAGSRVGCVVGYVGPGGVVKDSKGDCDINVPDSAIAGCVAGQNDGTLSDVEGNCKIIKR
jgi:hypothetical protein